MAKVGLRPIITVTYVNAPIPKNEPAFWTSEVIPVQYGRAIGGHSGMALS